MSATQRKVDGSTDVTQSEEFNIDVSLEAIMDRIAAGTNNASDVSSYQILSLRRSNLLQSPVIKKIERLKLKQVD